MTSAVKVDGERLYKKAHRGEEAERPTRTVTIHRAELLESDAERATFEIECSSGTYIRTLIETLGDAYCETLRRTAIGPHSVSEGADLEIPVETLMDFLPERVLSDEETEAVSHGRSIRDGGGTRRTIPREEGAPAGPPQPLRLTHDGRLIAIARPDGENLRSEVVLS